MWLLIFNLWYKKKVKKQGDIKQYIHLQKGLKTKQTIIKIKIVMKVIIILVLIIMMIIIRIKQKVK